MKVGHIFYALVFMSLWGCLDSNFDSNNLVVDNRINYLHPTLKMTGFPNDAYRIIGITPNDDYFNVVVEYSGGCNEHRFYTWWDGNFADVDEGSFYLMHENAGDACERLVRDTVQLDLNSVFYKQNSPVHSMRRVTVKNAYSGKAIEVDPYLAQIMQLKSCELEASLERLVCVQGIWENMGFLLIDSVAGYDKIWIQPVKNNNQVSLDIPSADTYKIDITPFFGYEWNDADVNCEGLPDGTLLPAAVNCIRNK